MAYGLSPRLLIEDGPAIDAVRSAAAHRASNNDLAWQSLDSERRLALVENALGARIGADGCSAAL